MLIEDGTGSGARAQVSAENRLQVSAVVGDVFLHANHHEQTAFVWDFPGYDYDAGDTVIFLRNNSNIELRIAHIYLYSDTATKIQVHVPATPATPAGTLITGVNLNLQSGNVAEATAYQDETANTQGTILHTEYLAANSPISIFKENGYEVILGKNDCIAIDLVSAGTMAYGHIAGYYHGE